MPSSLFLRSLSKREVCSTARASSVRFRLCQGPELKNKMRHLEELMGAARRRSTAESVVMRADCPDGPGWEGWRQGAEKQQVCTYMLLCASQPDGSLALLK